MSEFSYAYGNNFLWNFISHTEKHLPSISVESISVPSIINEHAEMEYQGVSTHFSSSSRRYDSITLTFKIDAKYENWQFIYKWLLSLYDPETGISENQKQVSGKLIVMNQDDELMTIIFEDLLPISLSELAFNTTSSDILTCDVVFNYTKFSML